MALPCVFGEVGAHSFGTHDEASCDLCPALRDCSGRAGGVSWFWPSLADISLVPSLAPELLTYCQHNR